MTTRRSLALIPALLLLAVATAAAAPAPGHDHAHAPADAADAALQLDDGRRWQTDAPLRENMLRVRAGAAAARAAGASRPAATAFADTIDGSIEAMVRACRLPARADATLHVLLGRLAAAAGALRQDDADAAAALAEVDAVLALYPRYFDHPQWQAGHAH